jgi:hypothetical protein
MVVSERIYQKRIYPGYGVEDGGIPWHYRKEDIHGPVPGREGHMIFLSGRVLAAVLNAESPRCRISFVVAVAPTRAALLFISRMN